MSSTWPTSSMRPVNTSPLPETGRDQEVLADGSTSVAGRPGARVLSRRRGGAAGGVVLDPPSPTPPAREAAPPSRIGAMKVRAWSMRPAAHESRGEGPAALEEQGGDVAAAELREGGMDSFGIGRPAAIRVSAPASLRLRDGRGPRRRRRRRGPGSRRGWRAAGSRAAAVRPSRIRRAAAAAGRPRGARSAAGRRRGPCRFRPRSRPIRPASGGPARGCARPRSRASRPAPSRWRRRRDIASFSVTSGRPVRACLRNGWLSRRAAVASAPAATSTSTPPSRRIPGPRPAAFSVGSSDPITTRAIPASRIASVQGGWRP